MKRVDNYIKTIWSAERSLLAKGMSREENEAYQIEKERRNEWLEGCKIVDRVISSRETPSGGEYFVKWKSECNSPVVIIFLLRYCLGVEFGLICSMVFVPLSSAI